MESAHHLSPRTIGTYDLLAELGQGGMAEVYLAVVRGPAGFVKLRVIKRLKADLSLDPDFQTMFLDEARLAARLDHPNIVHTVEVQQDCGAPFIAMEYIEGESLQAIRRAAHERGGQVPLAVVLRVLSDALCGLHHAHEACDFDGTPLCIVHRDVTPHNILVSYEGHAKVVDFGIAKARITASHTASGVIKGKITYLSPEQAKGEPVDRRSDIFSVGVMLYEALTGRRMWDDLVDYQVLTRLATGDVPSVVANARGVPETLVRICEKALALRPADRFATADEFHEAIESFLEESDVRVSHSEVGGVVVDLFREKRATTRKVIERELAELQQGVASPALPQLSPWGALGSSHPDRRASTVLEPAAKASTPPDRLASTVEDAPIARGGHLGRTDTVVTSSPSMSAMTSRSRAGVLGVAVVVLGLVAASVASLTLRSADPDPAHAPSHEDTARIDVSIATDPPHAHLFVDGQAVDGNPYRGSFPRDRRSHAIRAEAPGHEPKTVWVPFAADVTLRVDLPPASASGSSEPVAPAVPPTPVTTRSRDQRPLDLDDPWK